MHCITGELMSHTSSVLFSLFLTNSVCFLILCLAWRRHLWLFQNAFGFLCRTMIIFYFLLSLFICCFYSSNVSVTYSLIAFYSSFPTLFQSFQLFYILIFSFINSFSFFFLSYMSFNLFSFICFLSRSLIFLNFYSLFITFHFFHPIPIFYVWHIFFFSFIHSRSVMFLILSIFCPLPFNLVFSLSLIFYSLHSFFF